MRSFGELMQEGLGRPVPPSGAELSLRERRAVRRLVRRGQVAEDLGSARYAVDFATARLKVQTAFGTVHDLAFTIALAVLFAVIAVVATLRGRFGADDGLLICAAIVLSLQAWRLGVSRRGAAVALERNAQMLRDRGETVMPADPVDLQTLAHPRRPALLAAFLGFAVPFGVLTALGNRDWSIVGGVARGATFGAVMVVVSRRAAAQGQAGGDPSKPIGLSGALGISAAWARRFAVGVTVVVLLLVWVGLMGATQLPTCSVADGGLASGDQVGWTRAFCGTTGAPASDVVEVYALVGALPLMGLVAAIWAAGWVREARRQVLVWIGGALAVTVPVGLAWLAAGAH